MRSSARLLVTATLFLAVALGLGPVAGALFLLYLLAGWYVRPRSRLGDLGWDSQDELDRNLLVLSLALAPGYALAEPVAEVVQGAPSPRRDY